MQVCTNFFLIGTSNPLFSLLYSLLVRLNIAFVRPPFVFSTLNCSHQNWFSFFGFSTEDRAYRDESLWRLRDPVEKYEQIDISTAKSNVRKKNYQLYKGISNINKNLALGLRLVELARCDF